MTEPQTLIVEADGTMRGIAGSLSGLLRLPRKRRVSHIEPAHPVLRKLFYMIRKHAADDSWLAGFTRRWPCCWQVRIFNGPVFGPFNRRNAAVAAEIRFITQQLEEQSCLN